MSKWQISNKRKAIQTKNLNKKKQQRKLYLIVGIDPGTTTGIAILNLSGDVINLFSSKDMGLQKTIAHIISFGRVSLVASDVTHCPFFVSKVATKIGAKIFTPPEESLPVIEKITLTRDYKTSDSHQRDSLAAALTAYLFFKQKLQKIDSLNDKIREKTKDEIKHRVLQGARIKETIEFVTKSIEREKKEKNNTLKNKSEEKNKRIHHQKSLVKINHTRRLEKQVFRMEGELHEKEEEIKNLKRQIKSIRRIYDVNLKKEVEIKKRDRSVNNLKHALGEYRKSVNKIDELKILWNEVAKNKIVPVSVFPEKSRVTYIKRKLKKSRDSNLLNKMKIAFIDEENNEMFLKEKGIFVADKKYLKNVIDFYYVHRKDMLLIEKLIEQGKQERKKVSLDSLVDSYRKERISKTKTRNVF